MRLREKFKQWLDTNPRYQIRDVQLEVIADEFAIGFADWFFNHCYEDQVGYYEAADLLEKYKKEKGL